ncbi:hypothetical protein JTB14_024305 [Gonioctena quinquepunctata]|nr:hypothetical protein JTB14_024305 [Gonioctena quinquepunctata]
MREDEIIRLIVQLIPPSIEPYLRERVITNVEELMRLAGGTKTDLSMTRSNTKNNSHSERVPATPAVANTNIREAIAYRLPMLRNNGRSMPDRHNQFVRNAPPRSYNHNDHESGWRDQETPPNNANLNRNVNAINPINSGDGRWGAPPAAASRSAQ